MQNWRKYIIIYNVETIYKGGDTRGMKLSMMNNFLEILANGCNIYAMKRLVEVFFAQEKNKCQHPWILYVVFWVGLSTANNLLVSPLVNIISCIAGLFLVIWPYEAKTSKKVLAMILIYTIPAIIDSFVVLTFTEYIYGKTVNQIYECVVSFIFFMLVMILERTSFHKKNVELSVIHTVALGMVSVISIAIILYMMATGIAIRKMAVIIAGLLVINLLIFYLYNSLMVFYSGYVEKTIMEEMADVYAYQLEVQQESQNRVKSLRHDMKHHIIELSAMARAEGNPKMLNYLKDMEQFMLNPKEYASTGNQDIDGLLNYLLQRADQRLKKVDVKIEIPEHQFLKNFKICVILGNLVDNAIRESEKSIEKYLAVCVQMKKGIFMIFVENSYFGDITMEEGKIKTSRQDTSIHGIGLENVKKIVEADHGEMNIQYTEEKFQVTVLLYEKDIQ